MLLVIGRIVWVCDMSGDRMSSLSEKLINVVVKGLRLLAA